MTSSRLRMLAYSTLFALAVELLCHGIGPSSGWMSSESGALASFIIVIVLGAPLNVLLVYVLGVLLGETMLVERLGLFHMLLFGLILNSLLLRALGRRAMARLDRRRLGG
jgi:hypothetical protein